MGMVEFCLMDTEFLFGMMTQFCEYTSCHLTIHLEMVKMVRFVLLSHNFKKLIIYNTSKPLSRTL